MAPDDTRSDTLAGDALTDQSRLSRLEDYVTRWSDGMALALKRAREAQAFADGDQLTDDDRRVLIGRGQPAVIVNRIAPAINGTIGVVDRGRADPKALPRTPVDEDSANLATDTLRYIADKSRYQASKISALRHYLVWGWVGWQPGLDRRGDVVTHVIRPEELVWDPASREHDCSDARYLGVAKWRYVDEVEADYPGHEDMIRAAVGSQPAGGLGASTEDRPDSLIWSDPKAGRVLTVELYYRERGAWRRAVFVRGYVLEDGESPDLDEYGEPRCPIEVGRAYVDRENRPYGIVAAMIDPQREINARRSWMLRALVVRQVMVAPGGVADKEALRAELAKPDGVIEMQQPDGVQIIDRSTDIAGHAQLLAEAKGEIDRAAPNPALQGRETAAASGRALLARQQAGLLELAPVLSGFDDLCLRLFRQWWCTARQYWDGPKWIRVTDDVSAPQYLMLNEPVVDEMGQPVMEIVPGPDGQPVQQPVTRNRIAELDVDIIVDSAPDVASIQQEQFQALAELIPVMAPIAPPVALAMTKEMIASSDVLRNKQALIEAFDPPEQDPQAQQMAAAAAELQMRQAVAEVSKTEAEAQAKAADAQKTMAEIQLLPVEAELRKIELANGAAEIADRDSERAYRRDELALKSQEVRERMAHDREGRMMQARDREATRQAEASRPAPQIMMDEQAVAGVANGIVHGLGPVRAEGLSRIEQALGAPRSVVRDPRTGRVTGSMVSRGEA